MYSLEEKIKAVELYIESDLNERVVFRTLGYPSPNALRNWYKEYLMSAGSQKENRKPVERFSKEQKDTALKHYLENGMNLTKTSRALGYPNRNTLRDWVKEAYPNEYLNQISKNAFTKAQRHLTATKKQEVVERHLSGEADRGQ